MNLIYNIVFVWFCFSNLLCSFDNFKLNYRGTQEHAEQLVESCMQMRNMTKLHGACSSLVQYQDKDSGYKCESYPSFNESALSRRYVKAYTSRLCKRYHAARNAFDKHDVDGCLRYINSYFEQSAIFKRMLQDMSQVLEKKSSQYKFTDVYTFKSNLAAGLDALDTRDQRMKSLNTALNQKIATLALLKLSRD